jgi:hypothetical protein
MHGKGSVEGKQEHMPGRRNARKRIPVKGWALSSMGQETERGKNRPPLGPTVLALSPCRTRAGC